MCLWVLVLTGRMLVLTGLVLVLPDGDVGCARLQLVFLPLAGDGRGDW